MKSTTILLLLVIFTDAYCQENVDLRLEPAGTLGDPSFGDIEVIAQSDMLFPNSPSAIGITLIMRAETASLSGDELVSVTFAPTGVIMTAAGSPFAHTDDYSYLALTNTGTAFDPSFLSVGVPIHLFTLTIEDPTPNIPLGTEWQIADATTQFFIDFGGVARSSINLEGVNILKSDFDNNSIVIGAEDNNSETNEEICLPIKTALGSTAVICL